MGYMDKWPSRTQGQFYFLKLGRVGREHGLHPRSEGGVLRGGQISGICDLAQGLIPQVIQVGPMS